MRVEISNHAFAFANLALEPGETVFTAPGAMATIQGAIQPHISLGGGGITKAIFRKFADQTSLMSKYVAKGPGTVGVAPELPGDMTTIDLSQTGPVRIDSGAIVAYDEGVEIATRFAGIKKSMMNGDAVGTLARGDGQIVVSAYGGIRPITVQESENLIVDTGHLVAWSDGMHMKFGPLGGLPRSGLMKEGFVGVFEGPGTVLVQTRMKQESQKFKD